MVAERKENIGRVNSKTRMRVLRPPPPFLVFLGSFLIAALLDHAATGFSISNEGLPGIWKLYLTDGAFPLAPPQTEEDEFRARLFAQEQAAKSKEFEHDDEILLKMNSDGSFRQCSEGYREGCWISGRWKLKSDHTLLLAFDRQYYGPPSTIYCCKEDFGIHHPKPPYPMEL